MLRLLKFQVYNWGYAPFTEPLPVGSLNLCYGDNGSGKTTYLTGIGLLLGVPRLPKGKNYDHYVREGENWAFLKAVAANQPDDCFCQVNYEPIFDRKVSQFQREAGKRRNEKRTILQLKSEPVFAMGRSDN